LEFGGLDRVLRVFVERAPADDRRMVVVALQEFRPFVDKSGEALAAVVIAGIRRFAPDEVA